jgi:hypothetical protein
MCSPEVIPVIMLVESVGDLPPEKESSLMLDWETGKGALDGQEVLHARADYQQAA